MQCDAVWCSVLQRDAVRDAVCCSVWHFYVPATYTFVYRVLLCLCKICKIPFHFCSSFNFINYSFWIECNDLIPQYWNAQGTYKLIVLFTRISLDFMSIFAWRPLVDPCSHCAKMHSRARMNDLQNSRRNIEIPMYWLASQTQQTAIHCNTLQYIAVHYNTRADGGTAKRCNALQHTTNTLQHTATQRKHPATHCNPTANILQTHGKHTAKMLQHTATQCDIELYRGTGWNTSKADVVDGGTATHCIPL